MAKHHAKTGHRGAAVAPSANAPLAVAGAAILRQQYEQMRATEAGTRLGEDVEALHQMRVATRRLRAALGIFVPDEVREAFAPIEEDAREIARALGTVRDLDVLRDELRARAEAVPADAPALGALLDALERVRGERRAELGAVLDGPAARRFWEAFPGAVDALEQTADPRVTVRKAAPALLHRRLEKVTRSVQRLKAPTTSELHRLRIQCKRLRYACEFFKPWFEHQVEPIVEITTDLQDTLGSLHEGDLATDSLQALVKAALASGTPAPVGGYELTDATLALLHDRQQERDDLLVRFRDQRAKLRALARATKLKAT